MKVFGRDLTHDPWISNQTHYGSFYRAEHASEFGKDNHILQTNPQKNHITITRHMEDKQCKATSSLLPIKMIAKLERTQSNVQQNIEQTNNPAMGATINNESITSDQPPKNRQQHNPLESLNAFIGPRSCCC